MDKALRVSAILKPSLKWMCWVGQKGWYGKTQTNILANPIYVGIWTSSKHLLIPLQCSTWRKTQSCGIRRPPSCLALTGGRRRGLAAGCEAVEGWVVAVLDNGVHRLRLLQLEKQLLHGLNGVVPAQVDGHLLDLRWETEHKGISQSSPRGCEVVDSRGGSPFVLMTATPPRSAHRPSLLGRPKGLDYGCQVGVGRGKDGKKGQLGSWDGCVHTAMLKMDHQQGPAVEHVELCSGLCGSLDGRGVFVWWRMDTWVCMAESLHCSPETITILLTG